MLQHFYVLTQHMPNHMPNLESIRPLKSFVHGMRTFTFAIWCVRACVRVCVACLFVCAHALCACKPTMPSLCTLPPTAHLFC